MEEDERGGKLQERSKLYVEDYIAELKREFKEVFTPPKPGRADMQKMCIELEEVGKTTQVAFM